MGNAAKAAQRRERSKTGTGKMGTGKMGTGKMGTGKTGRSPSGNSYSQMTIVCSICKQPFMLTTRPPALKEHSENKHSKEMKDCFPDYTDPK